ncbi:MAG: DinB family protein [Bacteroidota bacterium]|nr:DinB family protein [Bacteroidota bacterium]
MENVVSKNLNQLTASVGPEFENTALELNQLFSSFNPEEINIKPSEDSWSAGQLLQHVIKVNFGFLRILNGLTKETDRQPEEKVAEIKANLLDSTIKRQAGEFVAPENKTYQKEDLLKRIEFTQSALKQIIQNPDLTPTCLAFEVPIFGYLTRLEALYFVIYHTQRHTKQLKNIQDQVKLQGSLQNVAE